MKTQIIFISFLVAATMLGCSNHESLATIEVSETVGLERPLEYVSVNVPVVEGIGIQDNLIAKNPETGKSVGVQVVSNASEKDSVTLMFPVQIGKNQNKTFEIFTSEKKIDSTLGPRFYSNGTSYENEFFKVTFSTKKDDRGGQVDGVLLKSFNDRLLKRGHLSMHWAPNFSKSDSENYFNFEDLPSDAENTRENYRYNIVKFRSGKTDSVPEIRIEGRYTFLEGQPYFLFESTMTMNQEVELNLLRNDEMTMDSLFTHVVYQEKNGRPKHLALYKDELETLEENPIPDNADFVAFYHLGKGYGFGSIRLEYNNTNLEGLPSPVTDPYTKISKSSGNGRYWNRVLSDTVRQYSKGSRYHEKNAYVVFDANGKSPETELVRFFTQLNNPLKIKVVK